MLEFSLVTKVRGVELSRAKLRGYNRKTGQAMERGVKRATYYLMQRAIEITPMRTGALRQSAGTRYTGRSKNTKGSVYFEAPYAVYVHEDLEAHHLIGEAKFIVRAYQRHRREITALIHAELNRVTL